MHMFNYENSMKRKIISRSHTTNIVCQNRSGRLGIYNIRTLLWLWNVEQQCDVPLFYLALQSFHFQRHLMKVIQEMCRTHLIWYLCFYLIMSKCNLRQPLMFIYIHILSYEYASLRCGYWGWYNMKFCLII